MISLRRQQSGEHRLASLGCLMNVSGTRGNEYGAILFKQETQRTRRKTQRRTFGDWSWFSSFALNLLRFLCASALIGLLSDFHKESASFP